MTCHLMITTLVRSTLTIGIAAILLIAVQPASANPFGVASDRFTYDGAITVFDTLADARNGANARSGPHDIPSFTDASGTFNGRDLGLFMSQGAPTDVFAQDFNIALTAWYYTLTGPNFGSGNPNNVNTGFFQLYDLDASTTTSATGRWNTPKTSFNLSVTGENATNPDDVSRLWHAPNLGGPGVQTAGNFIEYSLGLTATFANAAQEDVNNSGWFFLEEDPESVVGQLTGIFDNTCNERDSCADDSVDGFYVFDFIIGLDSWVFANQNDLNSDFIAYSPSYFGAAVPEPSTLLLLAVGLLGVGATRTRRKSRAIA